MKNLISLILFFLSVSAFSQTFEQGLRISLTKKTKEGWQPISNAEIEITINDSTILNVKTDTDGVIPKIATAIGKFKVKVKHTTCSAQEMTGIKVDKGKTAYVNFNLTCEDYLNSLSKREKRKLGYK